MQDALVACAFHSLLRCRGLILHGEAHRDQAVMNVLPLAALQRNAVEVEMISIVSTLTGLPRLSVV